MIDLTQAYNEPDSKSIYDDTALEVFGVEFSELIPEHQEMLVEEFGKVYLENLNEMLMEHIEERKSDES